MRDSLILIGFVLLFIFIDYSSAQSSLNLEETSMEKLSRFRLSIGYVKLLQEDDDVSFKHPFFNLSYRSSSFDRSSSEFKIKLAFEPGINGLLIANNDFNNKSNYSFYFLPYAKFGPDARLDKNLFLSASLGLALASYESNFAPLPFIGLNGFYLYQLDNNFSIEVEGGVHTSIGLPLFAYVTVGIALI